MASAPLGIPTDEACVAGARATAAALEQLGHSVEEVEVPTVSEEMIPSFIVLTQGGLADYEGVDWSAHRAAHRPPAQAQRRDRRLRLRPRRAHAGAAQPPGGRPLGPRLRRAAHADLGDPAAAWPARSSPPSTPTPEAPVLDVVASVSFTAFGNVTGLPASACRCTAPTRACPSACSSPARRGTRRR